MENFNSWEDYVEVIPDPKKTGIIMSLFNPYIDELMRKTVI